MKQLITKVLEYEAGELSNVEVVELFQELVDTGALRHLQGSYQRTARQLFEEGFLVTP
jgi:hypothetical protein